MALNMSKDSDSDRHTDSPTHQSDTDGEKDCELPMNLHNGSADSSGRRSAAGSGSDGEHSPASPSSDTGIAKQSTLIKTLLKQTLCYKLFSFWILCSLHFSYFSLYIF